MPLEAGCSKEVIGRNIAHLIRAGHDKDQAAAIAYANCRDGKALYADPRPLGLVEQLRLVLKAHPKPGVSVVKGADGLRIMYHVTSNGYKDREAEYITTKTLSDYVERSWIADDVCQTGNTLKFWHSAGNIGDVVWASMEADTFLIEASKERPDALVNLAADDQPPRMGSLKAVWDYIEANPDDVRWGTSHGFGFDNKTVNPDGTATYDHIQKFETSVLPLSAAANPYTYSGVIDMNERDSVLDKIVGQAGAAEQLRKGVQEAKATLDKAGVEHKSVDTSTVDDAKVKALLDTLSAKADTFLGGLMDTPPAGLKEAVVKLILASIGEQPASEEPAVQEAVPADTTGMMSGKSTAKLMDTLIDTQLKQSGDLQAIDTRIAELDKAIKALAPLNSIADAFRELRGEVQLVKAQLAGRPRAASTAPETVETNDKLLKAASAALEKRDDFWGNQPAKSQ